MDLNAENTFFLAYLWYHTVSNLEGVWTRNIPIPRKKKETGHPLEKDSNLSGKISYTARPLGRSLWWEKKIENKTIFAYFLGGLRCVGHFFAYNTRFNFLEMSGFASRELL